MAEVLETFPKRHGNTRYPWADWFDGRVWKLKQGEDFPGQVRAFRERFYREAQARGYFVQTRTLGEDTLVIQATKR